MLTHTESRLAEMFADNELVACLYLEWDWVIDGYLTYWQKPHRHSEKFMKKHMPKYSKIPCGFFPPAIELNKAVSDHFPRGHQGPRPRLSVSLDFNRPCFFALIEFSQTASGATAWRRWAIRSEMLWGCAGFLKVFAWPQNFRASDSYLKFWKPHVFIPRYLICA